MKFVAAQQLSGDWLTAQHLDWVNQHDLLFVRSEGWATDVKVVPTLIGYTKRGVGKNEWAASTWLTTGDASVLIEIENYGSVTVRVAGRSQAATDQVFKEWAEAFPISAPRSDTTIALTFWTNSKNGPSASTRRITVPRWDEIVDNYAASTASGISRLVGAEFKPAHGGQLLLMYGTPGTGKTWAIRALLREWRDWCRAAYIVDPEEFFGNDASYMLHVLLEGASDEESDEEEEENVSAPQSAQKWRVLILEDTGEMLSIDAKQRAGAGFAKLLNVVDGLIGQGLKIMVLMTTNDPLDKLHPAVSRAGRAAAQIEFGALSVLESKAWAVAHDIEIESKPHLLADLFAVEGAYARNAVKLTDKQPVGFSKN